MGTAYQGVEHVDMNVLVMDSRIIGSALAFDPVQAYLDASWLHLDVASSDGKA